MNNHLFDLLEHMERMSGQSEARAVAECIKDAVSDEDQYPTYAEQLDMAEAMAAEFVTWAKDLQKRLKKLRKELT